MNPSVPAIAIRGLCGCTATAHTEDINPCIIVFPYFFYGSTSSKIVDWSIHTKAESSATKKSAHLKVSYTSSSFKSVTASLGSLLVKEMLLMLD